MELSERDQERVLETAAENIARSLRQEVKDGLAEILQKFVSEAFDEEARAQAAKAIEPVVAKIVADGWPTTNSYGESTGARVSLRDRLSREIIKVDRYRSDAGLLSVLVTKHVTKIIDPIVQELETKVRAAVDEHITATLRATLKSALGLGR